ncbi:MAG: leucine-rich repeat protein, partial [Bacteroidales bacterium]|nr:leucine-rich repeat protein [Bacteroidales bacterium]
LKTWVSEQLEAYATIASVEEELAKLKASVDTTLQTEVDSLKQGIGAVNEQIAEVSANLDSAKVELKEAYTEAISKAVEEEHGIITTEIAAAIKAAKDAIAIDIEKLDNKIILLRDRIKELEDKVKEIAGRIRSVIVVPQYSDGSVYIDGVSNVLKFKVLPLTAAEKAAANKDNFTLDYVLTESRAANTLEIAKVEYKDELIEVTVKPNNLPPSFFLGKQTVSASLNIKDAAATEIASKYFPLDNPANHYLTFKAEGGQTFTYTGTDLQWSVNGYEWNDYSSDVTFTTDYLFVRGNLKRGNNGKTIGFSGTNKVQCTGDIRTLVDYAKPQDVTGAGVRYNNLFKNCTVLETAPTLPSMILANRCYESLFSGCISLKEAPELPATTLAGECYLNLFQECKALTKAPEMKATTLAFGCYSKMFQNCTSLKEIQQKLPATTLSKSCYHFMFKGCTSLEMAPELPATTLADNCYWGMFMDCNLTKAPELPATTLEPYCYYYMFNCCSKLSEVTMLATSGFDLDKCVYAWLYNAGTDATTRKLKVKNSAAYDAVKAKSLPNEWRIGATGTTVVDENNNTL